MKNSLFSLLVMMAILLAHGDMALPVKHYKAISQTRWRQLQGLDPVTANDNPTQNPVRYDNAEADGWGVVCVLIVVAITVMIVFDGRARSQKQRLMYHAVLIGMSGACCLCAWAFLDKQTATHKKSKSGEPARQMSERDYLERVEEVAPETSESYEEYLLRVDRLKRHICLKCYNQMVHRLYSWHCPKCEPDYFVCEKCGGAKAEAYYRDRYLYCTKCGEGRERPSDGGS